MLLRYKEACGNAALVPWKPDFEAYCVFVSWVQILIIIHQFMLVLRDLTNFLLFELTLYFLLDYCTTDCLIIPNLDTLQMVKNIKKSSEQQRTSESSRQNQDFAKSSKDTTGWPLRCDLREALLHNTHTVPEDQNAKINLYNKPYTLFALQNLLQRLKYT